MFGELNRLHGCDTRTPAAGCMGQQRQKEKRAWESDKENPNSIGKRHALGIRMLEVWSDTYSMHHEYVLCTLGI